MGLHKNTKSWKVRYTSKNEKVRLVDDLTITKNYSHPISFKHTATVIIPVKSVDIGIDAQVCKEYAIKILGKDEQFFKTHVLHHDLDGTMMYIDKKLHQSRRHLGYRQIQRDKMRKELGLI